MTLQVPQHRTDISTSLADGSPPSFLDMSTEPYPSYANNESTRSIAGSTSTDSFYYEADDMAAPPSVIVEAPTGSSSPMDVLHSEAIPLSEQRTAKQRLILQFLRQYNNFEDREARIAVDRSATDSQASAQHNLQTFIHRQSLPGNASTPNLPSQLSSNHQESTFNDDSLLESESSKGEGDAGHHCGAWREKLHSLLHSLPMKPDRPELLDRRNDFSYTMQHIMHHQAECYTRAVLRPRPSMPVLEPSQPPIFIDCPIGEKQQKTAFSEPLKILSKFIPKKKEDKPSLKINYQRFYIKRRVRKDSIKDIIRSIGGEKGTFNFFLFYAILKENQKHAYQKEPQQTRFESYAVLNSTHFRFTDNDIANSVYN
ncbi:hypothetical protein M422DRAFT_55324 [Sphaerobolus stellatus SS14]|uniref:Uncharacterized protein n=1 Tax=Sphaerobolus stellatus (strain SS14) TaxID=990650 RepID=A0A0C9UN51_SPHS4|nr:hypothetical protein M422DRAFT_55324 [Sphaerobolus stellatus SS14]